jgi:hypothetical protein
MKKQFLTEIHFNMKKLTCLLIVCILTTVRASAQFSQQERDSINQGNLLDHQLMMKELGVKELRPGPSGDPNAPNAANSDEAKVSPYTLPDPLLFYDGSRVTTPEQWQERRLEIMEEFDREIYGRVPVNTPTVAWEAINEKDTVNGVYPIHIKHLVGRVDNSSYPAINVNIRMTLTTPAEVTEPAPVIVEFGWDFSRWLRGRQQDDPAAQQRLLEWQKQVSAWQQQLLAKGWGYAILFPTSIQADNGAGLREGIIGLVNKGQPRKLDDWGALRAWAWGASRAMDYFETDPDVDETRVGIEGLSRYGKAALVALAYEPRIAIGLIGSSGAGGAKILRRVFGEQVENLASSGEYHWFAPNFINYAGPLTASDLPVDAHELVALCAPRPVFISVGSPEVEGQWVDAKGMFLAGVHAGPVYELLGKTGLGTDQFPPQETSLLDGEIAFRQHAGGHTVGPNWPAFIKYAEKYFSQ